MIPQDPGLEPDFRARRQSRAKVTALLLGAFVVLMFAITIAKMAVGK